MAVEIKFGDHIKESLEICKANLVPTLLTPLIAAIAGIVVMLPAIIVQMVVDPTIGSLLSIPLNIVAAGVNGIFMINFMAAVKAAKHEGKAIAIGDILNFENAAGKALTQIGVTIGFIFCCIPGVILFFAPAIVADKPGTSPAQALKAALAFGKGNIVPMLILLIVFIVLVIVGQLACGVGVLFTLPLAQGMVFLAYDAHKASVEAAAAEGGVQLG
ncbi:MAG: hypothetical protein R3F62_19640 [Planctomycetota bacterium]